MRPTDAAPPRGRAAWIPWVVGALVVLPVLLAGVSVLGKTWWPVGDSATIEMLVRDVGHHTPLTGFNSRFFDPRQAWDHPGPWMFYALALPYRLAGDSATALLVGATIVGAAFAGATVWMLRRIGGTALVLWGGLLLLVFVKATGYEVLRDPWNPWAAVLPFVLYVVAVWAVTEGDLLAVPVAVLAGSFALDNHVSYAAMVGVLGVWGLGFVVARAVRARRDADVWPAHRRRLLVALVAAVAVLVVFWAPVAYEQVTGHPGNLTRTYRYLSQQQEPRIERGLALRTFAAEIGVRAPWLGFRETLDRNAYGVPHAPWSAFVTLALFAVAVALAWRRRAWDALRLQGAVALLAVTAFASLLMIRGATYAYLYRWMWVVGFAFVLAIGWGFWRGLADDLRARVARPVGGVVLGAIALLAVGTVVTEWSSPMPLEQFAPEASALVGPVVRELHGTDGPVLVRRAGLGFNVVYGNMLLGLERAGLDGRIEPQFEPAYREHRVLPAGTRAAAVVTVVEGEDAIAQWEAMPDQRLVARYPARPGTPLPSGVTPLAAFVGPWPPQDPPAP